MDSESLKEAIDTFDDPPHHFDPERYWREHPERHRLPGETKQERRKRLGIEPKAFRTPSPFNKRMITKDPRVINMIATGVPIATIARMTGLGSTTIKRHMRRVQIRALIEREARRILEHLPTRNLNRVTYDRLSWAAMNTVRTLKELENAEKPQVERINSNVVQQITIAVFGSNGQGGSPEVRRTTTVVDTGGIPDSAFKAVAGPAAESHQHDLGDPAGGFSPES